jgi:NitT/TauT family transport system ATP-binding protein
MTVAAPTPQLEASADVLVRVEEVEQFYNGKIRILGPISLEVRDREFLSLVGPSGSGKSTLLRMVTGVLRPTRGTIWFGAQPLRGVNRDAAMVFQSFALFPWMTVLDNVALGLEARGVGLRDRIEKELSRGMKQLVGVARALAVEPELLCLDEPFSALDVLSARTLRDLVLELWASPEVPTKSILLVTHSVEEAVAMSDRVVVLKANPGRVTDSVDLRHLPRPRRPDAPAVRETVDRMYGLLA